MMQRAKYLLSKNTANEYYFTSKCDGYLNFETALIFTDNLQDKKIHTITRKQVEEYFKSEVENPIDENVISRYIINKFMEDDELEGKALRSQKDIDENTMLVTDLSTIQKCMIEYGKQILCSNVASKNKLIC